MRFLYNLLSVKLKTKRKKITTFTLSRSYDKLVLVTPGEILLLTPPCALNQKLCTLCGGFFHFFCGKEIFDSFSRQKTRGAFVCSRFFHKIKCKQKPHITTYF